MNEEMKQLARERREKVKPETTALNRIKALFETPLAKIVTNEDEQTEDVPAVAIKSKPAPARPMLSPEASKLLSDAMVAAIKRTPKVPEKKQAETQTMAILKKQYQQSTN